MLGPLLLALALGAPARLCSSPDARIAESSGVAVSARHPGVLYTHNDSGDRPRFFALDRSCRTLATFTVAGAQATDWEDAAAADGVLWLGDIGDNRSQRPSVQVYRVDEPARADRDATVPATRYDLVYPDGAHDAETLLVQPGTGRLAIVTKDYLGSSDVFAAPLPLLAGRPNRLTRIGGIRFTPTGSSGGPDISIAATLAATGGDISPDGTRVVVRTYNDVWEWAIPAGGDLARAFAGPAHHVPLPETRQGEAIAFAPDGRTLLATSEGSPMPLDQIDDPAAATPVPSTPPSTSQPKASLAPERASEGDSTEWVRVAAIGLAVVLVLVGLVWRFRAGRRLRRP